MMRVEGRTFCSPKGRLEIRANGMTVHNTLRTNKFKASELIRESLSVPLPQPFQDFAVSGLTCDSRQVRPGHIFLAIAGSNADGADFAAQAASDGAQLVITHRRINNFQCAQIVVPDVRAAGARLASTFYRLDELCSAGVKLIGITGTNGKTTVSYVIQHVCESLGIKCARLGTIEYDLVSEKLPALHTTPEPVELCRLVRRAYDNGAKVIALEVSSHALDQARVAGLKFAAAVFTNLSGDHLDYHQTMAQYLQAKLVLFKGLDPASFAVINVDDPRSGEVISSTDAGILTYGIETTEARVRASVTALSSRATDIRFTFDDRSRSVSVPYIGKHNVYNLLAGVAAGISMGLDFDRALGTVQTVPPVPGRLERIEHEGNFDVFVDYAHTDNGLDNVLKALKSVAEGRIIVVFGCGGDRDRSKRPRMARVAEQSADRIVVTSDNPRTEEPRAIIDDIVKGLSRNGLRKVQTEPDRAAAIRSALAQARSRDIVLIAGKGHEPYQLIGPRRIPFDDRDQARDALRSMGLLGADPDPTRPAVPH